MTIEMYIQKVNDVVTAINDFHGKFIVFYRTIALAIMKIVKSYRSFIYLRYDAYNRLKKNPVYKALRLMSFPWHYFFIWGWRIYLKRKNKKLIYDDPGVHIIIGPPGSGKSSLMYMLIERLRIIEGKPSYINSAFEKPRMSENDEYLYKYHPLYKFSDFFRDRKIVMEPNELLFASMGVDEGHRLLNYRENGTTDYNDRFVPFMDYAVQVRHKIKRIYFSTQMGKADTQLMNTAQTITAPRADIGFKYDEWLFDSGLFRFNILGFHIDVYDKDINGEKSSKPIRSFYIKNEWANFDYFDTYAMKDSNIHIPKHYPINMVKGRLVQS